MLTDLAIYFELVADPDAGQESLHWWELLAGILALPGLVFGAVVTYKTIRKTGLESRKLELEIEEKRRQLDVEDGNPVSVASAETRVIAGEILENKRILDILLRFVLLFLFLQAWSVVNRLFNIITTGTTFGLVAADMEPLAFFLVAAFQAVPAVAYWLVLWSLGWPIFVDIAKVMHLEIPEYLLNPESKEVRWIRATIILIAILSTAISPALAAFL